ncbi:hypothetical protein JCM21900_005290 [Sporobolomyces salmonicolor]
MSDTMEARVMVLYTGGTIGMLKTEAGGYAPHPGFLASNLRSQSRFHDPTGESVFANSFSVGAFSQWSARSTSGTSTPTVLPTAVEGDPTAIRVHTSSGRLLLPSLVTPRTAHGKRIRYVVWEYEKLIDSSEVELSDWINLAQDIERNYHLFDGFVILHGTDTMAYSASALSFLLEDLGKTVIITGSQIPLCELFTDAIDNLLASLIIAGHYTLPEVGLFFANHLYRGNRSTKSSSEEFQAFSSPNAPPLATVGIDIDVTWAQVLRPGPRPFRAHKALSAQVTTLRIFPGITGGAVRAFLKADDVRGVVLESYGAGNAPRREELLSAFREAAERGVVIVNVTQCNTGSVAPDIYETGRALAAVGIVSGGDMTTECALAKLAYLLSKPALTPAQVRKLITQPLRGELTPVSPVPTYSSPLDADGRLRTLFAQIIECSPSGQRDPISPPHHSTFLPDTTAPPPVEVPSEFAAAWPSTLADEEAVQASVLPYLFGQAATRADGLLGTLLQSHSSRLPAILNEPTSSSLQTPLHLAVLASQPHNVDLLLAHGASVHSRDSQAHSALFLAAKLGGAAGLEMVKSLRAAGAHLSELEVASGEVGLEVVRSEKAPDEQASAVWKEAAGEKGIERAKNVLATRERTFLSWIKLTIILLAISSALLIRFQFGQDIRLPQYELDAQVPLGVLFFACAIASLVIGTSGFFNISAAYLQRKGFAYAGKVADAIVLGIGLLIIAACILLLVAD